MSKVYTWDEVRAHNSRSSCWFVYKGKVLDVTSFLDEHPGGDEIVIERGGKDSTQEFDDIGHSKEAYDMLNKYVIGTIEGAAAEEPSKAAPAKAEPTKAAAAPAASGSSSGSGLFMNLLVTALVVGAAIAIRAYFK